MMEEKAENEPATPAIKTESHKGLSMFAISSFIFGGGLTVTGYTNSSLGIFLMCSSLCWAIWSLRIKIKKWIYDQSKIRLRKIIAFVILFTCILIFCNIYEFVKINDLMKDNKRKESKTSELENSLVEPSKHQRRRVGTPAAVGVEGSYDVTIDNVQCIGLKNCVDVNDSNNVDVGKVRATK
jgi:hypothetical protein